MRVALVVPGGVDRTGTHRVIPCLLWLIERLTAAGTDVQVFAHSQESQPGSWPLLGATVHNAGAAPRAARMLAQLVAEHRRQPFDLLHAVWASPAGVVAAVAGKLLRTPVLLHLNGGDLASLPEIGFGARAHWRGRLRVRLAAAGATHITVPSTLLLEQARAIGLRAERVPYGVALDRWPPSPPRRRDPRAKARLLHVGSLNLVKDQTTLLQAATQLRAAGLNFQLDIIGEDTLGGKIQSLAHELGLNDQVTFHGFLPHAELRPWIHQADLLVITSRHEADPIVLVEAAVAGVPTVGTAVGHLLDWAPNAAVAVPVGAPDELATEIIVLLADEERRLRMAVAAQALAIAENADVTAQRVLYLYARLAGGQSGRPRRSIEGRNPPASAIPAKAGIHGEGA